MTWGEWVRQTIGKDQSYATKCSEVAKLLGPYQKFRTLALSFDSIYVNRENIKQM